MNKKKKMLSLVLVAAMAISMLLTGCGKEPTNPTTPGEPIEQGGVTVPTSPITPDNQPSTPNSDSSEEFQFVRDGKVYINEIIGMAQGGISENHCWVHPTGREKKAAKEIINYRSSDEVQDWNIYGAMDDAFKVIPTSPTENLKNGDVVTWTYEIDEGRFERLKSYVKGIEFVVEDGSLVIEGLEPDVIEVNPFETRDCLSIEFVRDDLSLGNYSIMDRRGNGSEYSGIEIEVDTTGHEGAWSNGDQVKIKIISSPELLEEYGYILTTYEGYVTISGLD